MTGSTSGFGTVPPFDDVDKDFEIIKKEQKEYEEKYPRKYVIARAIEFKIELGSGLDKLFDKFESILDKYIKEGYTIHGKMHIKEFRHFNLIVIYQLLEAPCINQKLMKRFN